MLSHCAHVIGMKETGRTIMNQKMGTKRGGGGGQFLLPTVFCLVEGCVFPCLRAAQQCSSQADTKVAACTG